MNNEQFDLPGPAQVEPRNGFGITALVTALVGLVPCLMPVTSFFGVMFGIVAVVFGFLGLGRARRGAATSKRLPLSGLIIGLLTLLLGLVGIGLFFGAVDKLGEVVGISAEAPPAPVIPADPLPPGLENKRIRVDQGDFSEPVWSCLSRSATLGDGAWYVPYKAFDRCVRVPGSNMVRLTRDGTAEGVWFCVAGKGWFYARAPVMWVPRQDYSDCGGH
ncbi:DUF4190 domain-containing protein [Pseudonocardia spinosispora]|uniref:DUF4190 domain-containing protein n=1 Tax=Pseudonocardia spinosispora TaxID=103441 RepID=UPI0003FDB7FF|nr:DUF4190 domain-containing protein [Pseudonocardia spinosispora]